MAMKMRSRTDNINSHVENMQHARNINLHVFFLKKM